MSGGGGVRRCCDGRAPSVLLCGGFVSVGVVFFLFWFSGLWVVVVLPLWGLVGLSACLVGWGCFVVGLVGGRLRLGSWVWVFGLQGFGFWVVWLLVFRFWAAAP